MKNTTAAEFILPVQKPKSKGIFEKIETITVNCDVLDLKSISGTCKQVALYEQNVHIELFLLGPWYQLENAEFILDSLQEMFRNPKICSINVHLKLDEVSGYKSNEDFEKDYNQVVQQLYQIISNSISRKNVLLESIVIDATNGGTDKVYTYNIINPDIGVEGFATETLGSLGKSINSLERLISGSTSLLTLDLGNAIVTDETLPFLAKGLTQNQTLTSLTLNTSYIYQHFSTIVPALQNNKTLLNFTTTVSQFSLSQGQAAILFQCLADIFQKNNTLQSFKAGRETPENIITEETVETIISYDLLVHFFRSLNHNKSLISLSLNNIKIIPMLTPILTTINPLQTNQNYLSLSSSSSSSLSRFSQVQIDRVENEALNDVINTLLRTHPTLERFTCISDTLYNPKTLIESLSLNRKLRALNLSPNKTCPAHKMSKEITNKELDQIADYIQKNNTLTTFIFEQRLFMSKEAMSNIVKKITTALNANRNVLEFSLCISATSNPYSYFSDVTIGGYQTVVARNKALNEKWSKISLITAFARAHKYHPLKYSILTLSESIFNEIFENQQNDNTFSIQRFTKTLFFSNEVYGMAANNTVAAASSSSAGKATAASNSNKTTKRKFH